MKTYLLTSMMIAVAATAAIEQAPQESEKKLLKRGLFNLSSGHGGSGGAGGGGGGGGGGHGGWLKGLPYLSSSSYGNQHDYDNKDHLYEYDAAYVDNHLPSVVIDVNHHHYQEPLHVFETVDHAEYLNDQTSDLHQVYANFGGDLSHFSKHAGILDVSYDSHGHELGLSFPDHTSYHH